MGNRTAIDTFTWLIHDAFEGDWQQSLLANLRNLRDEDWTALPPGGGRTIADILEHVGWAKWMYEDYAFGSATLRGDVPPMTPAHGARSRSREELLAWLKEGQKRWLESLSALQDDSELDVPRLTSWGERLPTRTIIRIVLAEDVYHAGEINHLRALLQKNDKWPYDP